ncbi:hypothetical protein AAFF_G00378680 [Aldrovandia affinis]|uniref:Uncharacterized protein n=1 Tax=Aldrovandia affinis TaxID=143900 RepID=A0AAD7SFD0_9TELE|nr:hypothetical protein AAFF_G00378680 [Aldrovandia affinis]
MVGRKSIVVEHYQASPVWHAHMWIHTHAYVRWGWPVLHGSHLSWVGGYPSRSHNMPEEGRLPPEQLALPGIQLKPSLANRSEHVVEVSEGVFEGVLLVHARACMY